MSTLKTHNLQSPDASDVNVSMAPNRGIVVTGISTFNSDVVIPDGDMGVGTNSPDRKLDVSGTGNVYGKFQSTNATGAGIEVKDTAERWLMQADGGVGPGLAFYDLGRTTYRMIIDSNGRLIIGATSVSPANSYSNNLVVSEASGNVGMQFVGNNSNSNYASIYLGDAGGAQRAFFESQLGANGNFTIGTAGSGSIRFTNSGGERLRIYSSTSGNGGIAKFTTPTSGDMLNLQNSTASGQGLIFGVDTSASPGYTYWKNNTTASYDAAFIVGGSERLRINSAGTVRIKRAVSTSLGNDSIFLALGDTENGTNVNRLIGFGYVTTFGTSVYPASMGYTESDNSGNTKGALVFNTRNTTGATDTPTERLRITSDGKVGINDSNPGAQLVVKATTDDNPALQLYRQSTGGDIASINWKTGAGDQAKINYRGAAGDNEGLQFYTGGGSSSNQRMVIDHSGKIGIHVTDPKSLLHVYGPGDIRMGSVYGGFAMIALQVSYASGYTGTHFMFEITDSASWTFNGSHIVYGQGGSSYGMNVTYIRAVAGREAGANNSGDTWRNGTHYYDSEVMTTSQIGLNPGAGTVTFPADSTPDGAGSTRSLFKIAFSASGQGVGVWAKLTGQITWGASSTNGRVRIKDKDNNVLWDSNP